MASRHHSRLLAELAFLPWWVCVIFAGIVYAVVRWLFPALADSRPVVGPLAQAFANQAWWLAAVFLLPVPFALFNARRRRRLFDRQLNLDSLRALPWRDFELLVGEAYRRQGYQVIERGGGHPDGGIDLELRDKDKKLVVQCKRWQARTVGVELVRELYGAMVGEEAHAAIFVTSGTYTPDAIDFARDKPIKLLDGHDMVTMLWGVEAPRSNVIAPQQRAAEPRCPRCGSAMVHRIARRDAERGRAFWGCSRYPTCSGTRPA